MDRSADQTRGNSFVQRRLIVCCSVRECEVLHPYLPTYPLYNNIINGNGAIVTYFEHTFLTFYEPTTQIIFGFVT